MGPAHLHVVCGGGTGSLLLKRLHSLGYHVSAGPLSELDDDARTGAELAVELALIPAAGALTAAARPQAREMLLDADGVILTPFAVGKGNLDSLALATELPDATPLYLVDAGEFARRDYTGGEATRIYERLRARASARPRSIHELIPLLRARFPLD